MSEKEQVTGGDAMSLLLQGMRAMQEELRVVRRGQQEMSQRLAMQAHKDSFTFKKKGQRAPV